MQRVERERQLGTGPFVSRGNVRGQRTGYQRGEGVLFRDRGPFQRSRGETYTQTNNKQDCVTRETNRWVPA